MKYLFLSIAILAGMGCMTSCANADGAALNPVQWVDPYIGTGGHGHTFLGVAAPFGAVQLGPTNINKGWDWCSGYHYSDSVLIGFSHLHLNGTGCCDSGDLLFMPYTGERMCKHCRQDDTTTGYGSRYSHERETATPGYYSVMLDDYDVRVELTATERVGFHRYTFPDMLMAKQLMIDLSEGYGDDRTTGAYIEKTDDFTISGYRYSTGWSKGEQRVYFAARFSAPVHPEIINDTITVDSTSLQSEKVKVNVRFAENTRTVMVKVGVSPVCIANAVENLEKEIPDWDFDGVSQATTSKWNDELSKVKVNTVDERSKRIFYTGLYHSFLQPVLFSDVNGDYRGADGNNYKKGEFTNYTVFSLWDTYRAAHPLYTILQPERVPDFINSLVNSYEKTGLLPVWHLYGSDTYEMIGIQSVPVIADAILKDIPGFDREKAYEAMRNSMLSDYKGLNYVRENEYIPADKESESVAKGLEYALADWSVAMVAKKLGKKDEYGLFMERAGYYRHYWDPTVRFFRGKNSDGSRNSDFNPFRSIHRSDDYCEGNAWQYTWLVPHDVDGLMTLMGGKEAFVEKLDSLFMLEENLGAEMSPDITGLIGQYAHGNEPGHHITYLYALAGEHDKTAEIVRHILTDYYDDKPDGIQGNEDCGQMSSWYVFSSMGFYPVQPAGGEYVLGAPIFDSVEINLPDDKVFKVISHDNSDVNKYVDHVKLNGKDYDKPTISHSDIMNGGTLEFFMASR